MARGIEFLFSANSAAMAAGLKAGERGLEEMQREAVKTDAALRAIKSPEIKPDLNAAAMAALRARLVAQREQIERDIGDINVDIDATKAIASLNRIEREINKIDRLDATVNVDVDRDAGSRLALAAEGATRLAAGVSAIAGSNPYVAAAAIAAIGTAAAGLASFVLPPALGAVLAGTGIKVGTSLLEEVALLEASKRKFETVFGDMTTAVETWAGAVSVRGGVGVEELKGLAAGVQDLLVPRGYSRADAAGVTKAVIERGIALAEFSGRDKADGIQAITAALLGEREQLKGLGVDIAQSEVQDWLKNNADAVAGMSEGQAEVAATLALIEAKSKDAWSAYQQGGSTAEASLDSFRAKLANFKDDVIALLGAPLQDIIASLSLDGVSNPLESITQWLRDNQGTVKAFFIDLGQVVLTGADVFLAFADTVIAAFQQSWGGISQFINLTANGFAGIMRQIGGLMSLLPGAAGETGRALVEQARATQEFADATREAGDRFVNDLAPAMRDWIAEGRTGISAMREELAGLAESEVIRLSLIIEQEGISAAKAEIATLSGDQLVSIIASIDPASASAAELDLLRITTARLVEINPELQGKSQEEVLRWLGSVEGKNWLAQFTTSVGKDGATPYLNRLTTSSWRTNVAVGIGSNLVQSQLNEKTYTVAVRGALSGVILPGSNKFVPLGGGIIPGSQPVAPAVYAPRITISGREVRYIVEDEVQRSRDARALQDVLGAVP